MRPNACLQQIVMNKGIVVIKKLQNVRCAASRVAHYILATLIGALLAFAETTRPAIAEDCTSPTGKWIEERPSICLKDPGWFDIGAGLAVIPKAGIEEQNGVGNLVTVRAYPFGRWYAPLKSQTPASTNLVASKLASANALNDKAKKSKQAAVKALTDAAKAVAQAGPVADLAKAGNAADQAATNDAATTAELVKAANDLVKAATDARATDAVTKAAANAKSATDLAATDQAAIDTANADIAQSMQTALNDFGSNFAVAEFNGMTHLVKRVSLFMGRSVGGFDSKAVDGDINAFGIAFDIAPEFSVVWGRAYYNQPVQTGVANSSKSGTVIGVQLNLNAFKAMRGLTGSF
jgi:hypothetical protein